MNNTQKLFYRYKYEQKLPLCIRYTLTETNIHHVINSKDVNFVRSGGYPIQFGYRRKKDNIKGFVFHALHNNDIKMLRVVLKRFPEELLKQVFDVTPKYEPKQYIPLRMFNGWKIELDRIKNSLQ